jgi:nicotinate-nucleotide adenylyltransferase
MMQDGRAATPARRAHLPTVRPALPRHAPGMRIGLFGGSFNPPHEGHRLASLIALRRLSLDRVWWLVTPGNPLKDNKRLTPLAERIAAARRMARHPLIDVTGFEAAIGTRYSYTTIDYLKRRCPGVRFVWLIGADSLAGFDRWRRWRAIAAALPIAVIDRPGSTLAPLGAKAAQAFRSARIAESEARKLPKMRPPAWVFLHGPRSAVSSTALRQRGDKPERGRR